LMSVLGACGAHGMTGRKHVVGIGDSLLRVASPDIRRALDSGYEVTITARSGQRIDQMLPDLQNALRRDRPVAAVIENLGTNNAIQARGYSRSLSDFDQLIADTNPVGCVVLTTISTYLDKRAGGTVARDIDARIRELHRQNPRKYPVVDWDALIHAPLGLLHWSGLPPHENAAGARWFADQYAQALLRCGINPFR
ncbi:MAG: SGNH/GDSL hydrolase family protein, partial [Actinomycetota bacterium]|nr:SGNH/GDSL hydrolase family protein [Actinomycetota bacterium]